VLGGIGGFGALFEMSQALPEPVLVSGTDGVGTKLKLAIAAGRHDTSASTWSAMCVNDVLVQGAEPLFFLDYFATGKLDVDTTATVVGGHRQGLRAGRLRADRRRDRRDARHVPAGRIRPGRLLPSARWRSRRSSTAARSCAGDVLIGIASSGPHSNGYSLVRKILDAPAIPIGRADHGGKLADALMAPTRIYVKPVLALLAGTVR
jgi:phosphoribosylformylglycinamidine cyclo-ligase